MDNFLNRLNRNPYQPIDSASITRVDELGNGYDDWNNLIAPKFEQPQQTWGETALGVATAPARLATALAGSVSPYGPEGWQVPPIIGEGVNALTAVGDAYTQGMSEDEINNRALGMAGFMMGGGGIAAGRGGMVAANASKEGALPALLAGQESKLPGNVKLEYDLDSPFGKTAYAIKDGYTVGEFSFDELPNALMMRDARVDPEFRRQGIASEVYGKLQDEFGLPMTPDITLTPEGYSLWKKNYPEAVKNYTFNGISWRPDGAHADPSLGYQAVADGVPDWRMSGGPNRPDGVAWSNASKEGAVPGIAGALGAEKTPMDMALEGLRRAVDDDLGDKSPYWNKPIEPRDLTLYHGTGSEFDRFNTPDVWASDSADMASNWAMRKDNPSVIPLEVKGARITRPRDQTLDPEAERARALAEGYDAIDWGKIDGGHYYQLVRPGTVRSATTGETLFSNASKEGAVPGLASALSADPGVAGTGTSATLRLGEGSASPNLPPVGQMADDLQGRSLSQMDQPVQAGQNLTMSDQSIGASKGPPIGSFLDKNYYPGFGLNPIHTVNDWSKVRSMARKAIKGEHVPGYLYDGLPNNGNLLAGTHRSAANELLEKLGYNQRIDRANIKDVLDDPSYYGLTPDDAMSLREAVDDSAYDIIDDIWDQTRDTSVFSNADSRPALLASALGQSDKWSPTALAERMARKTQQARWHPSNTAERLRAKMEAPQLQGEAVALREQAASLDPLPAREMTPTARGTARGSLGLMPAVKIDGKVYTGPNHAVAALDSGLTIEEASKLLANEMMSDGYVTKTGEFVTRREAEKLLLPHTGGKMGSGLTTQRLQHMEGPTDDIYSNADSKPALLASALGQEQRGITAYHGSPHDFDKFDLSKIGSGEGAQAYGHGLYFAENEGVARSYRDNLGGGDLYIKGEKQPFIGAGYAQDTVNRQLMRNQGNVEETLSWLNSEIDTLQRRGVDEDTLGEFLAARDNLSGAAAENAVKFDQGGKMYQVRINANPEDFLDWDKPLSQQSEKVRQAMAQAAQAEAETKMARARLEASKAEMMGMKWSQPEPIDPMSLRGADLWDRVPENSGIPGTRYLDQMSREAGDGSYNYAVWNDSLIEILKKYGLAGAVFGSNALTLPSDQGE